MGTFDSFGFFLNKDDNVLNFKVSNWTLSFLGQIKKKTLSEIVQIYL